MKLCDKCRKLMEFRQNGKIGSPGWFPFTITAKGRAYLRKFNRKNGKEK